MAAGAPAISTSELNGETDSAGSSGSGLATPTSPNSPFDLAAEVHFDPVDAGVATIEYLVEYCIKCFDADGEVVAEWDFPTAFFLVHQWFVASEQLGRLFARAYAAFARLCPREAAGDDGDGDESSPSCVKSDCRCRLLRTQLLRAVGFWMRGFPAHFLDDALQAVVAQLRQRYERDRFPTAEILDLSSVPDYSWMRHLSQKCPIMRQVSLSFEQWLPDEIANCLTHIEYKMLRRIPFDEYKRYAQTSKLNETPNLERSISVFNGVSHWVQCMVLSKPTPRERAEFMSKFVKVGRHLRKMQNFNTLMAVIGGISHSCLARLTKTHACLSQDIRRDLTKLSEILSHLSNYSAYRSVLEDCRGFMIPIVGVHLKDLIAVNVSSSDYTPSGLIDCKKMRKLADVYARLMLDLEQSRNLPQVNMDLVNTLKVSLDIQYKDNDIYELSLKREPRALQALLASPFQSTAKPLVFAEWADGVSSAPDPTSVEQHVAAMVDAVFKHYDHDKDGYISRAEFDLITGNFPFIDPFVILDADRDGQISKAEMKDYFIRVNKSSAEFRRGFKHNFHETTFLKPTECAHCQKVLWGLLRQGFKCKDCALPVHRICKDSVVVECRKERSADDGGHQPNGHTQRAEANQTATQRRRLFLHIRPKPPRVRTVSTASDSPSPEPIGPTPPVLHPEPSGAPPRLAVPGGGRSLHNKQRARSDTHDVYRCQSPDFAEVDVLPSLASEEVFEEESRSLTPSALR